MQKWLFCVFGVAIVSVLVDVVLPVGQTRKYIKTVVGIVVTLVLVQPLASLVCDFGGWNWEKSVEPQEEYLQYVCESSAADKACESFAAKLAEAGFDNPKVTFDISKRKYTVKFCEGYGENLYRIACSVEQAEKCAYPVQYVWS